MGMLHLRAPPSRLFGSVSRPCKVDRSVDQMLLKALFMKAQNETLGKNFNALAPLKRK